MFLKSNEDGNLSGNGSSRWRQRAYYDFMKDITSNIKNIPIIRISIYDKYRGKTIDNILGGNDNKIINDFLLKIILAIVNEIWRLGFLANTFGNIKRFLGAT